jgi:hypothetical protein
VDTVVSFKSARAIIEIQLKKKSSIKKLTAVRRGKERVCQQPIYVECLWISAAAKNFV